MSNLGKDIFDEAYDEGAKLASIEIAKSLLEEGISDATIMKSTRVSSEEFQKLKEELSKESNP